MHYVHYMLHITSDLSLTCSLSFSFQRTLIYCHRATLIITPNLKKEARTQNYYYSYYLSIKFMKIRHITNQRAVNMSIFNNDIEYLGKKKDGKEGIVYA